jgi:hypothetical protein
MLTLTHADRPQTISDLAAGLTDLALELLGKAGARGDSVEMELELWRALTAEIEREFDRRRRAPSREDFHLRGVIEQAVHRAALRVAGAFEPDKHPAEIEAVVRAGVASLGVPADRRAALERLTPRPQASRRPLGRSGVLRRLQLTPLN